MAAHPARWEAPKCFKPQAGLFPPDTTPSPPHLQLEGMSLGPAPKRGVCVSWHIAHPSLSLTPAASGLFILQVHEHHSVGWGEQDGGEG